MLNVLIADGYPITRKGLKCLFRESAEPAYVGEAATFPELIHLIVSDTWDVIVLGPALPGRDVATVVRMLRIACPIPVLVLTPQPEDSQALQAALAAGAAGWVTMDSAPKAIVNAIQALAPKSASRSRQLVSSAAMTSH